MTNQFEKVTEGMSASRNAKQCYTDDMQAFCIANVAHHYIFNVSWVLTGQQLNIYYGNLVKLLMRFSTLLYTSFQGSVCKKNKINENVHFMSRRDNFPSETAVSLTRREEKRRSEIASA